MNLIFFTLVATSISHFVFLFYNTDFLVEYGRAFKLINLLKIKEYESWLAIPDNQGEFGHYPYFFRETYTGFWPHLIGCPFCLITFISMIVSVFTFSPAFILIGLSLAYTSTILFIIEKLFYKKYNS